VIDIWAGIAAERGAIADDLSAISEDDWDRATLCRGWTVRDVAAHMTATAHLTPLKFFTHLAGTGFSFERFATRQIRYHLGPDSQATLAGLRAIEHSRSSPPGPTISWLGEAIVHSEDIRRPLGIQRAYDTDMVREVADFYKSSNLLIGTKNRITGLSLRATDVNWSHGDGEEVAGPMLPLLMAMTGRGAACDDLEGPGVATLRQRSG